MKRIAFILLILYCALTIPGSRDCLSQVTEEWRATYSGPYGLDRILSMCIDSYGNVYVTGWSRRTKTPIIEDYATVKYNKSGAEKWVARYNWPGITTGGAFSSSVAVDNNGNAYVTGVAPVAISGNPAKITTIKYDTSGVQKWVAIFYDEFYQTSPQGYRMSIAVSNSFNIYVAGSAYSINSGYDYATIKYDSSGVQKWVARYHGPNTFPYALNQTNCIALDNNENVYVTGFSTGDTTNNDIATVKYDSSGVQKWVARYNGPYNGGDSATGLKVDNYGNVYVTGVTFRGIGIFGSEYNYVTIKYDSTGVQKWATMYSGYSTGTNIPHSIAVDGSGNVYVTGESKTSEYEYDCATIKYDTSGVQKWVALYDYGAEDWGVALALDNLGYVYVTAASYEGIRVHFATIKYSPLGVQQWSIRTYSVNGESPIANAVDYIGNVYVSGGGNGNYLTIKYNQLTGIQPISNEIPNTYRLEQNYPNPFNPTTKIKFSIPPFNPPLIKGGRGLSSGGVSLKVYDILGKEVQTLVNESLKPGTYEVTFDGSNLPSGVYFYQLSISNEQLAVKKMILLK